MACKDVCRLCDHLVISTAVAFTDGNLVVTLPQDSFRNGEKVCIVIAQSIPAETTIVAPVMIQIGTGGRAFRLDYAVSGDRLILKMEDREIVMQRADEIILPPRLRKKKAAGDGWRRLLSAFLRFVFNGYVYLRSLSAPYHE